MGNAVVCGPFIRDDLWPNPLKYFQGQWMEENYDNDEDDEEGQDGAEYESEEEAGHITLPPPPHSKSS